jgi:hypothetical protein
MSNRQWNTLNRLNGKFQGDISFAGMNLGVNNIVFEKVKLILKSKYK